MLGLKAYQRRLLRIAAVGVIAVSAGACSSLPSVPDWVDPTTWLGGDSSTQADNGQTPDLSSIPDRPQASTPDNQQKVADALDADRRDATYSANALRGGTEAAAPPPQNIAPTPPAAEALPANQQVAAKDEQTEVVAPPTPHVDRSVTQVPAGSAMPGTLPPAPSASMVASAEPLSSASSAGTESLPAGAEAPVAPQPSATESAPPPTAVASAAAPQAPTPQPVAPAEPAVTSPPPGAQPAIAPRPPAVQRMAMADPSDAALGFKPSAAPPLDPSVSQFVAPSIIRHYQQTASEAGIYSSGIPVRVAEAKPARRARHMAGVGGPEHMSGAVVANLDALNQGGRLAATGPSVYANSQGLPPAAVIMFPNDAVGLNAEARALVRSAVDKFKSIGEQGFVRVVGHSSSRTPNMSPAEHKKIVFEKSQERANAVAQELIRDGVPASKVLVEAVGDTQPVYYESMPKGEDGNRRAEIFLQS